MTLAVDWDVKHQFKQTKINSLFHICLGLCYIKITILRMQTNCKHAGNSFFIPGQSLQAINFNESKKVY